MDDEEYREIQQVAERKQLTVSEWVRWALRRARREEPSVRAGQKLDAVREAARHEYPTADIDQMLREIEQGYV